MTPLASPSTDEMGETLWRRPTEAVHVLAPRVRQEKAGEPTEPRTVAMRTSSRIFELEGSHGRHAAVDLVEV